VGLQNENVVELRKIINAKEKNIFKIDGIGVELPPLRVSPGVCGFGYVISGLRV
jgi:hypothetical protein